MLDHKAAKQRLQEYVNEFYKDDTRTGVVTGVNDTMLLIDDIKIAILQMGVAETTVSLLASLNEGDGAEKSVDPKPYKLFAGDHYYPAGGYSDFVGAFESVDAAKSHMLSVQNTQFRSSDWWNIVKNDEVIENQNGKLEK